MSFSVSVSVQYHIETCCNCGVQFAMTDDFYKERLKRRGSDNPFYCPNGHKQWYMGESDADKFRRERDVAKQQLVRVEQEAAEARADAIKAKAKADRAVKAQQRLEKRAAAGSCPCCQRTFSNMSRHMRQKHPEFVADNVVKLQAKK